MKKALKIISSIFIVEAMFFIMLYLMFSVFAWSFIVKNWSANLTFAFAFFTLLSFVPSAIIVERSHV